MKRAQWVQRILEIKPTERIKKFGQKNDTVFFRKSLQSPQYYIKRQQKLQTPSQLIQLCNKYKITTVAQLHAHNKISQQKISRTAICYWFGSWKIFKKRLNLTTLKKYKFDQRSIIDLCVRFNIRTIKQFQECHKKQPAIFPSFDWVQRHFGRWSNFKKILQACSMQQMLQKYIELKMKLGRYPSKSQCRKNGIQLQVLLSVWQPTQLRQTVQLVQGIYKNAKK